MMLIGSSLDMQHDQCIKQYETKTTQKVLFLAFYYFVREGSSGQANIAATVQGPTKLKILQLDYFVRFRSEITHVREWLPYSGHYPSSIIQTTRKAKVKPTSKSL
mgnify:CR=1 FL=1